MNAASVADQLGNRLGPRIAHLVGQQVLAHRLALTEHEIQVGAEAILRAHDVKGAELRPHLARLLLALADTPGMAGRADGLLRFAATHRGEAAGALLEAAGGSIVSQGIGAFLADWLAPAIQEAMIADPNLLLPFTTAATLYSQGIWDYRDALDEAQRQGINESRFAALTRGTANHGQPTDWLIGWLRGEVAESDLRGHLKLAGLTDVAIDRLVANTRQLLSPADLADMSVRGIIDPAEATRVAAQQGLDAADFALLVHDTGQPLALQELLLLFRRGQIDQPTLERGIRESRTRDEWIPYALQLRYAPPSPADAIRAAVQNQLPDAEARAKFQQGGLDPSEYDWMLATAGRPPGATELLHLLNRGLVSEAFVRQAIRESDVKDKYTQAILDSRVYLPPPRTVTTLISHGVVSDAAGTHLLMDAGLSADLAHAYVESAHSAATAHAKVLAAGTIERLYHDQAIDRPTALGLLESIRYDARDAGYLLDVQDLAREVSSLDAAITHVRALFVARKISAAEAAGALGDLEVPAAQVTALMRTWQLERAASVRVLTPAQIVDAWEYQAISQAEAESLLAGLGYSAFDAWVLLSNKHKGPLPDRPPIPVYEP